MNNFELKVVNENGGRALDFVNKTANFVEVVFSLDGQLIKGYCYPPYHHKPVKKMRDGSQLPFSQKGKVRAFIYSGAGQYKEDETDYEVSPFVRFRLNQDRFKEDGFNADSMLRQRPNPKVTFRRTSNNPMEVLEVNY